MCSLHKNLKIWLTLNVKQLKIIFFKNNNLKGKNSHNVEYEKKERRLASTQTCEMPFLGQSYT